MSSWPEPPTYGPRPGPAPYAETWIYLPPAHRSSVAHLVVAWLGTVLTAGYLLPWAVGATRNRTNCVSTAVINIFLGWTLVGWVVALVMACGSEPQQPVAIRTVPGPPFALPPPALLHTPTPTYPLYPSAQQTATEVTMPLPTYGSPFDDRRPGSLR